MAEKIHLEIVTPDRSVLNDDVDEVVVPGVVGEFGVLSGHTTFLTELGTGKLSYLKSGQPQSLQISGGFAEVRENHVTILADSLVET